MTGFGTSSTEPLGCIRKVRARVELECPCFSVTSCMRWKLEMVPHDNTRQSDQPLLSLFYHMSISLLVVQILQNEEDNYFALTLEQI
jgi:hypothetical protein